MIHAKVRLPGGVLNIMAFDMADRQLMLDGRPIIHTDREDLKLTPDDQLIFIAAEDENEIAAFVRKHFGQHLPDTEFQPINVKDFTV